jgi:hypothetical protein
LFVSDYRFLDRLLHRLALHYRSVAELSFDLDQRLAKALPEEITSGMKHVFIAGLARSGTTILLRRLHESKCFRSLTYRDMPFVLAPFIWGKLSSISRRERHHTERAHGDGIEIDFDSPESLEEVFWRTFCGHNYIGPVSLRPHHPAFEQIREFRRYVSAILSTTSPQQRYLSKNNNNILRLDAIRKAFPAAIIMIPFRDPVQQASSLLQQHLNFSAVQKESRFVLDYMTWLGHHEFGQGHRRFQINHCEQQAYPVTSLNYWLQSWCEVYSWLESAKPDQALFVCYEDLCTDDSIWIRLEQLADIPAQNGSFTPFKLADRAVSEPCDAQLLDRAMSIYQRLVNLSRADFRPE